MGDNVAAAIPRFPEDIERTINDALLNDAKDMCGTMSLVASRFYTRTKLVTFRTVIVRRHDNWTKRITELSLPNANLIRTLVIDVPLAQGGSLLDEELSHLRALVKASNGVRHLAVVWSIWARLNREVGSLRHESLYLIWDRTHPATPPSFTHLQHPTALTDLTVYAPPDLTNPTPFRPWGELYLPDTVRCVNLAYVAYAADRTPLLTIGSLCEDIPGLKAAIFILVDIPEKYADSEDDMVTEDREVYPNFSTAYLRYSYQVLDQWLAKTEGRSSVLDCPPPHAVRPVEEDE
ncbi:hypothetical protein C8R46DRAFT_1071656 [Mycena filopes]|nr:hypothetical protein C8R46DRAFT_1071656 [Mycena filopes]